MLEVIGRKVDGFFGDRFRVTGIIEYPLVSVEKELSNRIINGLFFSREEIENVLFSSIRGYACIERVGLENSKIRLRNIFIGIKERETLIKVVESAMLPSEDNYQAILRHRHANRDVYLAPEEFDAFVQGYRDFSSEKAGVFSLAASILDLCLMNPSREIYHFDHKQFDQKELWNRLAIAGKRQGPSIERFLSEMLKIDPKMRPSFCDLEARIPTMAANRLLSEDSRMRLSVVRSRTSLVNNDNRDSLYLHRTLMTRRSRSPSRGSARSHMLSSGMINTRTVLTVVPARGKEANIEEVKEMYPNGNLYVGQKMNSQKHGYGRYTLKDGSYYEGEWNMGRMEGKGTTYFSDQTPEYSGEWKKDEYHGWGTLNSRNPKEDWERYEGEFSNGVMEGRGKMFLKNGAVFDGRFKAGRRYEKVNSGFRESSIANMWNSMNPSVVPGPSPAQELIAQEFVQGHMEASNVRNIQMPESSYRVEAEAASAPEVVHPAEAVEEIAFGDRAP